MQAYMSDITERGALRIAGADAVRFLSVMYAGEISPLSPVGGLSQGAFLDSEGQVIDVATVLRTGDAEFLVTGSADNRDELVAWLSAHAALSDDAGRVFPDVEVQDASSLLGILLMAGEGARKAHDELMAACRRGQLFVIDHEFDEPAFDMPCTPSWILFAPRSAAAAIGDFLADYHEFYVLDADELSEMLEEHGTGLPQVHQASYAKGSDEAFAPYIRDGADFVGARALGR